MSFAAPLFLVGLLLVPVAAWAYAAHVRRRRSAASAFANPDLLPAVAPRRPGWRRHAPVALYAVAATALLVALARPQTTVAVPVEQATVMLVTDVSGSMLSRDVAPDRLTAARSAADSMVERLPDKVRAGLVAFNQRAQIVQSPTTEHAVVRQRILGLRSSGGTATGDGIAAGLAAIRSASPPGGKRPPAAILLLSDGASTRGRDVNAAAREAARMKVRIYTVALGTAQGTITVPRPRGAPGTETRRVPPDPAAMRDVARITGGRAFSTASAAELDQIYEQLGSQVSMRDEPREITAGFAGGAILFVLLAGALSLRWFGRLP
jgi:Ca-activated chloride channel family protein